MPAIPGENLLTTLFADVHYYFNDPSSKPLHHRFSKGSYAYIYYNPAEHRAKLEVANHAGTPDQDAFSGYTSVMQQVRYSYKQPTLCTVTIAEQSPQNEWHLPSYDERNEQKFLYKIHTLDIYLWTEKDAATFLGHLKAVLPSEKLDIRDAPASTTEALPAEHRDSMSPVVQQLEKTAVGTHFPPRAESTASGHSFPGPPTPSTGAAVSPPPQHPQQQQPSPFAYNPAAPAAPEPIAHREKTPPPVEDGSGPGLSGSRAPPPPHMQFAQHQGFQPSQSNTPQQSYFPGMHQQRQPSSSSMHVPGPSHGTPPSGIQRNHSGSLPPPPPPPGSGPSPSQYAPSFGPPPTDHGAQQPTSPPPNQSSFNRQSIMGQPTQQYASYPSQQPQFATYQPQSPGFNPSVQSPGMPQTPGFMAQQQQQQQPPTPSAPPHYNTHTPLQSPGFPPNTPGLPPPPPAQQQQQQPPVGGYSNYNYGQGAQAQPGAYNPHGAYTGDAHAQAYRPTEAETAYGAQARPPLANQQQQGSEGSKESFSGKYKVNDRVNKVEKGVGRFLKKLDSKW